jgi:hypothetical protein
MKTEMYVTYICDEQKGRYTCADCPDDFDCGLKAYPILCVGDKTYTQQEIEEIIEQAWQYRELCK